MRWLPTLLICAFLGACGDEEKTPAAPEADGAWSAPTEAAPKTAADVLGRVRERVVSGRALSGIDWQQDLEALADLLWRPEEAVGHVRAHMQLLQIAGDAGRAFARDPDAEEAWREQQPEDFEIHRSFLRASAAGPDAYRAWVAEGGAALLRAKAQRLQRHFERRGD